MPLPFVRAHQPVCLTLSIGVFLTFVFVTIISIRGPVHMKTNIRDHLKQFNIPLGPPPPSPHSSPETPTFISFEYAVRALYQPILAPINAPTFTDPTDGVEYTLPGAPIWVKPLGRKLCIVDIDTRPLNETDEIMNEEFNWETLGGVSVGMLNHYLYATIHGYDYKFIHTSKWHNGTRDDVWTKVPALAATLKDYRFVVMIDADAIFRNLNLPYEWLLNRWNITEQTSIAMPLDPVWDIRTNGTIGYTNNKFGVVNPNAGFVTAQNLPRTFDMLDAWIGCPDMTERFPGCDAYRTGWPAEQGAFGEHIRYEFDRDTDFKPFDCTDGNGFPNQFSECRGLFVRHYTTGKGELKGGVGDSLLETLFARTHGDIMKKWGDVKIERNSTQGLDESYL